MLFLMFGLPAELASFVGNLYTNLRKYTCFNGWSSSRFITANCGLIQGCSISILAMNLHQLVWITLLRRFSSIQVRTYIDDSYLWTLRHNIKDLGEAVDLTDQWDVMTGQVTNIHKCQIWGTSTPARKAIKDAFPAMKFSYVVDVLGAKIQTSHQKSYEWPDKKTTKIKKEIALIAALPCNPEIKEHIIAAKVIPQLSFVPHLNCVPKAVLATIQGAVTKALWGNRPGCRNKWAVLGILHKPHRVDPGIARAYGTILDVFSFLRTTCSESRNKWAELVRNPQVNPNSLLAHFMQACSLLSVELDGPFHFSMMGSSKSPCGVFDYEGSPCCGWGRVRFVLQIL